MSEGDQMITIRISRELKEKMQNANTNWSEEIRNFVESRLNMMKLAKLLKEIEKRAKRRVVSADSSEIIRRYRDMR